MKDESFDPIRPYRGRDTVYVLESQLAISTDECSSVVQIAKFRKVLPTVRLDEINRSLHLLQVPSLSRHKWNNLHAISVKGWDIVVPELHHENGVFANVTAERAEELIASVVITWQPYFRCPCA